MFRNEDGYLMVTQGDHELGQLRVALRLLSDSNGGASLILHDAISKLAVALEETCRTYSAVGESGYAPPFHSVRELRFFVIHTANMCAHAIEELEASGLC